MYILEKVPWTKNELKREQGKDKGCKELSQALKNGGKMSAKLLKVRKIRGIIFVLRSVKRGTLKDEFLVPVVPNILMATAFKDVAYGFGKN